MVREKEIAATFFHRMAECLEDVEQRRWFRRMAQDEKDQRKILLKHRRELCGSQPTPAPVAVSAVHETLERTGRATRWSFEDALRLAMRSAEEAQNSCSRVAEMVGDRSCRIFLKILNEESQSHREELQRELQRLERDRKETVEAAA